jgi:hypothetical protein
MPVTFKNARISTILPKYDVHGRQCGYTVGHSVLHRKCWVPNAGSQPLSLCGGTHGSLVARWRHVTPLLDERREYRFGYDREFQKTRMYAAERSLASVQLWGFHEATSTPLDTARFLDKVLHSATFKRRWGRRRIELRYVPQLNGAHALLDTISLPTQDRVVTPLVVLHELAHCLCPVWERHGRLFAANYLELVRLFHPDQDAYPQLKSAFRAHGVKKNARRVPRAWEAWGR